MLPHFAANNEETDHKTADERKLRFCRLLSACDVTANLHDVIVKRHGFWFCLQCV